MAAPRPIVVSPRGRYRATGSVRVTLAVVLGCAGGCVTSTPEDQPKVAVDAEWYSLAGDRDLLEQIKRQAPADSVDPSAESQPAVLPNAVTPAGRAAVGDDVENPQQSTTPLAVGSGERSGGPLTIADQQQRVPDRVFRSSDQLVSPVVVTRGAAASGAPASREERVPDSAGEVESVARQAEPRTEDRSDDAVTSKKSPGKASKVDTGTGTRSAGPKADPREPPTWGSIRLLGLAVDPDGTTAAVIQLPGQSPRLVRAGDRIPLEIDRRPKLLQVHEITPHALVVEDEQELRPVPISQ